jgi:hypothetical protein
VIFARGFQLRRDKKASRVGIKGFSFLYQPTIVLAANDQEPTISELSCCVASAFDIQVRLSENWIACSFLTSHVLGAACLPCGGRKCLGSAWLRCNGAARTTTQ